MDPCKRGKQVEKEEADHIIRISKTEKEKTERSREKDRERRS